MKTYKEFWHELNEEFHFTIDVCADHNNHMLPRYYTIDEDGLKQDWNGEVVWCNPPFGEDICNWIRKIHKEKDHATIIILMPYSETWMSFRNSYYENFEVRNIGKLKFSGQYGFDGDLMLLIFRN